MDTKPNLRTITLEAEQAYDLLEILDRFKILADLDMPETFYINKLYKDIEEQL